MYSFFSKINPAYRTACTAWFVSRLCLWSVVFIQQTPALLSAPRTSYGGGGAPMLQLLKGALDWIGSPGVAMTASGMFFRHLWSPWGMIWLLGELVLLAGAVSVYHFARRDSIPQVAEHATWLWLACPLMVWTALDASWSFTVGLGALSLALAGQGRHRTALVACMFALGFKPEFLFLWPALAFLGWKSYMSGRHPEYSRFLLVLGPPALFTGWIVFAIAMAGRLGVSLRDLRAEPIWRLTWSWQGWAIHRAELWVALLCVLVLALAIRYTRQTPRAWMLIVAPCAILPLLHEPASLGSAWLLVALPAFAYLGRATENPVIERPVLAGSLGMLLILATTFF